MINYGQTVLVLDDEIGFRTEIQEYLESKGHTVYNTGLPSQALEIIQNFPIDIALFDIRLPEMDGISLLKQIKDQNIDIDVVMMTGYGNMEHVVHALRYGAVDFLNKPFKISEIHEVIDRISRYKSVKKEHKQISSNYDELLQNQINLIGESKKMLKLKNDIQKVASADDTTVLITGESGTGKELVARSIHLLSKRKGHKFLPVNCSSIPEELFENEFFGHVKGSYTDAKSDQKGLFEIADKGTLFLDEIGDMKYAMQSKLLRVIEEKKVSRIGRYHDQEVDVRIIAATNQDIELMVKNKEFRQDLFHRLNIFRLEIPPLRQRIDDIPLLFDHFVGVFKMKFNKSIVRVERNVVRKLKQYDFPGNVRELMSMIERAVILSEGSTLKETDFPNLNLLGQPVDQEQDYSSETVSFDTLDLGVIERNTIVQALKKAQNNKSKAARILNISRQALDRKIRKFNIVIV